MGRHCLGVGYAVVVAVSLLGLTAQATVPQLAWTKNISTGGWMSSGPRVAVDATGKIAVCGVTDGSAFGSSPVGTFVAEYTSSGSLLWNHIFPNDTSPCGGVAVDGSGNVVAGVGAQIMKYDSTGKFLWNAPLSMPVDSMVGVAVDGNGNTYATGSSYGTAYVTKISSTGQSLWMTLVPNSLSAGMQAITVDPTGNATLVVSYYHPDVGQYSGLAAKLNTSGKVVWNKSFDSATTSVAAGPAGSTFLTAGGNLIKYDSANNQLWSTPIPAPRNGVAIAVDPSGMEYVAGGSGILKYNSDGTLMDAMPWNQTNNIAEMAYVNQRLIVGESAFVPPAYLINEVISSVVVPEPSSLMLLTLGAAGLPAWRRRRI